MTFRERLDACLKHWLIIASSITGAAAVSAVTVAKWDQYRPYATTVEIGQVAQYTYPPALSQVQGQMLYLQKRIEYLEQLAQTGSLKPDQWAEITTMRHLYGELKEKETQIIKEQANFRRYLEYR